MWSISISRIGSVLELKGSSGVAGRAGEWPHPSDRWASSRYVMYVIAQTGLVIKRPLPVWSGHDVSYSYVCFVLYCAIFMRGLIYWWMILIYKTGVCTAMAFFTGLWSYSVQNKNNFFSSYCPALWGFWFRFGGVCSLTYCNGNFRVTMVSEPFNVILQRNCL